MVDYYTVIAMKGKRILVEKNGKEIENSEVIHAVRDYVNSVVALYNDVIMVRLKVDDEGIVTSAKTTYPYNPESPKIAARINAARAGIGMSQDESEDVDDSDLEIGWKLTRGDGKDWHSGTINYRDHIGKEVIHPDPDTDSKDSCGVGLHLGKTIEGARTFVSPGAVFRCSYHQRDVLGEDAQKVRVSKLHVLEECPAWVALGPNGKKVREFLDKFKEIPIFANTGKTDNMDYDWAYQTLITYPTQAIKQAPRFMLIGNQIPNGTLFEQSFMDACSRHSTFSLTELARSKVDGVTFSDIEKYEIDEIVYNRSRPALESYPNDGRAEVINLVIGVGIRRMSEIILGIEGQTINSMAMDVIASGHVPFQIDEREDGRIILEVW